MAQQSNPPSLPKLATTSPVAKSHSFRVVSLDAESACFPSGVMATACTPLLCPERVRISGPSGGGEAGGEGTEPGFSLVIFGLSEELLDFRDCCGG